jgi:probable O-glycosylation ligase (exosortase A-associated)
MRDLLIVSIVALCALVALRRPWIGVMCWTWLSIMNPHRYTYGIAYDAPLAALAAVSTMGGFLATKDRSTPFKGTPVTWLTIFMVWMTLSWLLGQDVNGDYEQWSKVMKIDFMTLVGLALLHSRLHVMVLCWVCAGSLAVLGAKGGLFTVATGGNYRVWGPAGSFIADNNHFACALVMTIPLLRFLQMQMPKGLLRHMMTVVMLLCAAAALGSQSRGALLAISAMVLVLWWRGRNRLAGGVLLAVVAAGLVMFMPQSWEERMSTIQTYQEDRSAMGRISAWWVAWGIAKNHLLGVGFDPARPELFQMYSPFPDYIHAAHSIYFQVMGNHGFIGLLLFLGLFVTTFVWAGRLRREGLVDNRAQWCADLGAMVQVSLVGYAVGGAFLSLAYFDLPYNLMMMVVLARAWLRQQRWKTEPVAQSRWAVAFGLRAPKPVTT